MYQKLPNFKITQDLLKQAHDSKVTIQNIETPGWTSLVHTEASADRQSQHRRILNKLNAIKTINNSQPKYTRIRVPAPNENHNILQLKANHSQHSQPNLQKSKHKQCQRNSLQIKDCNMQIRESTHMKTSQYQPPARSATLNNLNQKTQDSRYTTSHMISTNSIHMSKKEKLNVPSQKRFHQISVHEHLYLQSRKRQATKMIKQILDQQFQRKSELSFTPKIGTKSRILAQNKISRLKQDVERNEELMDTKRGNQTFENNRSTEQIRLQTLNRLYYWLTENESCLTNKNMKKFEELPLPFLKYLQPIIAKIYRGQTITWLQFLGLLNSGKGDRLSILAAKWFSKQNAQDNLNL